MRAYRARNQERYRGYDKRYKANKSRTHRRLWLRKNYGLTVAEFERMESEQGGVCAICGQPERASDGRRLAVDHCHMTGNVRALLCGHCNRLLGKLEANADLLPAMFAYLEHHGGVADVAR